MKKPNIIAVANQKGGTGKTTTSINLGACLASLGQKTLLIDLDPQANLTSGLNIVVPEGESTVYELIKGFTGVDIARKSEIENLYVVPSGIELAAAEAELMGEIGREQQLRSALFELEEYDYIIIDTAPTLGVLMLNALSAATEVIIPVQAQTFAVAGLKQLLNIILTVQARINPELSKWTVLPTMVDFRRNEDKIILQQIKEQYNENIFESLIRVNSKLIEATRVGQAVSFYDKYSRGAKEYYSLAKELLATKKNEGVA